MQQIVYTRCKPRRELLNVRTGEMGDGKVVNEEGYAIHNFSEGVLKQGLINDPLFVENMIKGHNAAKEMGLKPTGIFYSYEYFYNIYGGSILGQEYIWPYNACKIRPNGQHHRPETHIKQYILGEFEDYPCLLFGADCWDAAAQTANFYYHDRNEPLEFLPEPNVKYGSGSFLQEKIRNFISDGRAACVKQLISAVISEMSKPIDDRKFIVIKDLPENVEMWIAAVEFAMPVYLAKQISFNTNVVATDNLSVGNTFYCDAENKFIKGYAKDARDAGGKKNYYAMIVGIHPAAQGSDGITFGMNNVSFLLLDGQTRMIENAQTADISSAYFDAVVRMDEDISDFNSFLSELDQVKFGCQSSDLYELFDGYKYLHDSVSDSEEWEYARIKRFQSVIKKYDNTSHKWSQRLSEKVYSVYDKFYEEDEKNDLTLLKQIISMDHANNLESKIENYLIGKYLLVVKHPDADRVNKLNKAYSMVYPSMGKAMEDGFKESIPAFMDCAANWNSDQSYFMFCKLYDCFNSDGTTSIDWHRDATNARFIGILFDNIREDSRKSTELLTHVSNSPVYLDLAVKGAAADYDTWIKIICSTIDDIQIGLICDALLEIEGISMQQFEMFLTELLATNKERDTLLKYLIKAVEKFGVTDDCSSGFVEEYLKRCENNAGELKYLVNIMVEKDMGSVSKEKVYSTVKDFIDMAKIDKATENLAKEFEKWRNGLKRPVGRAYYIVFLSELRSAYDETVVNVLDRYIVQEPIVVNSGDDMKKVAEFARHITRENKVIEDEVFVKLYHIFKENDFPLRKILLFADIGKPEGIIRCIKLIYETSEVSRDDFEEDKVWWRDDFKDDIEAIGEDLYMELKDSNIDKLEKSVLKAAGKGSPLTKCYKEYFEYIRENIILENDQIKSEKKESRKELKEIKKEAKERKKEILKESAVLSKNNGDNKNRWFSVFFALFRK